MKNFLWFTHEPADEREQTIFNTAYQRALFTTWVSLSLYLVIHLLFWPSLEISLTYLFLGVLLILSLSYAAGWTALSQEDLTYKAGKAKPKYKLLLLELILWYALIFVSLILAPHLYYVQLIILLVGTWVITAIWVWQNTGMWGNYIRYLLTLLAPFSVLLFPAITAKSLIKRLALVLIGISMYIIIPIAAVQLINGFLVDPLLTNDDLLKDDHLLDRPVLLDYIVSKYYSGDYVLYHNGDFYVYGKIVEKQNGSYLIQSSFSKQDGWYSPSAGAEVIKAHDVVGRVIFDFPKPFHN